VRAIRASRYSPHPVPPTNVQRKALRRELASGQGFFGRLRTFWALPPRPGRPTRGTHGRDTDYVDIRIDRRD
jgi:hypothetical protein